MIHSNESRRLAVIEALNILDTPKEACFDNITSLVSQLLNVPICAITLMDKDRVWYKSSQGLTISETRRNTAFCQYAIQSDLVTLVKDTKLDPRFCLNPLVLTSKPIRFYAAAPLKYNEVTIGTLFVMDTKPRAHLSLKNQRVLLKFSKIVTSLLSMRQESLKLEEAQRALKSQEDLIDMMQSRASVGFWRVNIKDQSVEWSDTVFRIHGLDPSNGAPDFDEAVNFYHIEDRPKVSSFLNEALISGHTKHFSLRLIRRDQTIRQVYCCAKAEYDRDGRPCHLIGVFQDITEVLDDVIAA